MMTRCMLHLVLVLGLVAGSTVLGQTSAPSGRSAAERPNIVLIVADDLGYADLGCQGAKDVRTPSIDSLADNGIRFTDGYVSCPVCSPTRAGLMTGRYQQRFGHEFNPGPSAQVVGLPLDQKLFPQYMKELGYKTGLVGKWHLGSEAQYVPTARGFDEFFGFPGGAHSYIDAKPNTPNAIMRGTKPVNETEYLTDAFNREAVAFIRQHAKEPFFLYLAFNAVHTPQQCPDKYTAPFSSIQDPKRRMMAGMLAAMDVGVGNVLKTLREAGIEENTLVFFIADNGGPTPANGSRNTPFSGYKGQVLEGGIRVPFIMQWKNRLPAGKTYTQPVISLDILPTALAAAGASVPTDRKVDGVNLLPFIMGEKESAPHEALYWRFGSQAAIRQGDYKLLIQPQQKPKLINLKEDVAEQHDLSEKEPQLAARLDSALKEWSSTLAQPLWKAKKAQPAAGQQGGKPAKRRAGQNK